MDMVLYQHSHHGPPPQQSGGLALCLRCTDLEHTRQRAMALGGQAPEPVREESFGREQWLLDPEGNRFLVWEEPQAGPDADLDSGHEH